MKLRDLLLTMTVGQAIAAASRTAGLRAFVYRGPASCEGCPESVGDLLETSPTKINVTYVGPNEDTKLTAESLSQADIYAHPGGGGTLSSLAPIPTIADMRSKTWMKHGST